jgi:hypothetical protein
VSVVMFSDGDGDGRADRRQDHPLHGISPFSVTAAAEAVAGRAV